MPVATLTTEHAAMSRRGAGAHGRLCDNGSLRDRLRRATADAHARLDVQFGQLDLRRRSDYRRFLEMHAAALLPLEAALVVGGVAQVFPDWEERSRSRAIADDLIELGGAVRAFAAPHLLDFAGVLGTMYVLEGSRLGAKVIFARVADSPDASIVNATAFLRHGGELHLWRSFLPQLERHAAAVSDPAPAVRAACAAFDLFSQAADAAAAA